MDYNSISRTPSGLIAEATIRDVDCIFHIEGKGDADIISNLPDYIFYDSILSMYSPKKYEIKVEGGKSGLKCLANELASISEDDETHVIIMDRDHDSSIGIPLLDFNFIKYTHGYSYENDFWTSMFIRKFLSDLSLDDVEVELYIKQWKRLERRIAFIHKLNLLARANGRQLFAFKGLCGITFSYENDRISIDKDCISRVKSSWSSLSIQASPQTIQANQVLKNSFLSHPGYLIQGHAYESYVLEFINLVYGKLQLFPQKTKNNMFNKNTAFLSFKRDPSRYLAASTLSHYSQILQHI